MPRTQAQRDATEAEAVAAAEASLAFDAACRTHARAIDQSYSRGHMHPWDQMQEAHRRRDVAMVEAAGAEALAWLKENP